MKVPLQLETSRLILPTPTKEDILKFQKFQEQNKEHFAKWETLTDKNYKEEFEGWKRDYDEGRSVRFFLFAKEDPESKIIGMCNFTHILRGSFQACYLGYKMDHRFEGKGLMTEALERLILHMFKEENLHRIMATYIPRNQRSARVLQRLGFVIEGHAKDYLRVNGHWEDHVLTALTNPQWVSS